MEGKRMPVRYRMDETGQIRRTWNGRLPEEFNKRDMLLFMADTELTLHGCIPAEMSDAVRKADYSGETGRGDMPHTCMENENGRSGKDWMRAKDREVR